MGGLLLDDLYDGPQSTAAILRGYDLVNLVVAAPVLLVGTLSLHGRSRPAYLAVTSVAAALAYTDAYHLFGTGFDDLFLVHVAVFAAALVTFVLGLRALAQTGAGEIRLARPRARLPAGLLGVLTCSLAAMWVVAAMQQALDGTVPTGSRLVETETVVRLGMALDLGLLVPGYAAAVLLLWRGAGWGLVLGTIAVASGLVHQAGSLVAMPMQVAADVPGAVRTDAAEPVIVLVYLFVAVLLARSRRG